MRSIYCSDLEKKKQYVLDLFDLENCTRYKLTPTKSRNLIRLKYAIFESEVKCIIGIHCLQVKGVERPNTTHKLVIV